MRAYRVSHMPITFGVGQQLGLTPDQVAARAGPRGGARHAARRRRGRGRAAAELQGRRDRAHRRRRLGPRAARLAGRAARAGLRT